MMMMMMMEIDAKSSHPRSYLKSILPNSIPKRSREPVRRLPYIAKLFLYGRVKVGHAAAGAKRMVSEARESRDYL